MNNSGAPELFYFMGCSPDTSQARKRETWRHVCFVDLGNPRQTTWREESQQVLRLPTQLTQLILIMTMKKTMEKGAEMSMRMTRRGAPNL
mmetsp:Transcript_116306/g.211599  ORF Transcript_116306/g.211599 Transcript_116306/m.211599 type:complete len:90 (+) Transcript_116306:1-270(+)